MMLLVFPEMILGQSVTVDLYRLGSIPSPSGRKKVKKVISKRNFNTEEQFF